MANPHSTLPPRGARWIVVLLAVGVIAATLLLPPRDAAPSQNRIPSDLSPPTSHLPPPTSDLQHLLAAQIAMVCPSGAREFDKLELTSAQTPADPWLVDPDQWFVPEDRAAKEPTFAPVEPAAPKPEPTTTEPPASVESPQEEAPPSEPDLEPPVEAPAPPIPPQPPLEVEGPALEDEVPEPPVQEPFRTPAFAPPPPPTTPVAPRQVPETSPSDIPDPPDPAPAATPGGLFAPPPPGIPNPHGNSSLLPTAPSSTGPKRPEDDPHRDLLAENCYPSAKTCAKCHEKIYHEWSSSSHAYAFVSPMFHKFEQKITELSQGTVGYFCIRCHSPVATSLNIPRDTPLWEMPEVAREGVTCVACHRVRQPHGKTNGERHIVPGDIHQPVYGTSGGVGVAEAIAQKEKHKFKTSPDETGPGQPIHTEGIYFEQLGAAEFCQSCHQVAVHPGIKLEVVWEQYRQSPAHAKGISCQECHMGKVPGVAAGYDYGPVAEFNGVKFGEGKKHSNHVFYGPGYSIAHPGIFPMHLKSDRWSIDQWLAFDWRAGWGTDEFEQRVDRGEIVVPFPKIWAEADDRCDAREIIDENLKKLAQKTRLRTQVMENGSHVDGPFFANAPTARRGLKLSYVVTNTNDGHNLPTASLGAQPQLWANVVLIGSQGERLWETGYTDRYGDVCDHHSRDVRAGIVPADSQLFNLQTMFLITGATGTDREFFLPVNVSFDQLPFLRPGTTPNSVLNHPPFIRMESRSIAPLGKKEVHYSIPPEALPYPGRYRLSFRMRSRTEPIYFMDFCGGTPEMARAMNEGMIDVHPFSVEFDVR